MDEHMRNNALLAGLTWSELMAQKPGGLPYSTVYVLDLEPHGGIFWEEADGWYGIEFDVKSRTTVHGPYQSRHAAEVEYRRRYPL